MSNLPQVIDTDAFARIEEVAKLHLQNKTPYQIGKELGIKTIEAKQAIAQWQEIVQNDMNSRDAARDYLNDMVHRYEELMREARDNLANLKSMSFDEKISAQINTTLKLIGELDAKRVEFLQKAGLLDASDLGDELAEREEREALIIDVMKNTLCENCKNNVGLRIEEVMAADTVVYNN